VAAPHEAADRLIAEGNRAEQEGRQHDACELYRRAVGAAAGYAKAHLNLGIGLEASGDSAGAQRSFEAALALDPRDAYASYNLANLLAARGELNRAAQLLLAAVASRPEFPEAHVALANVYDSQGDSAAAAASLERALQQRPDYAGARHNYGLVLCKLAEALWKQGRMDEVIACYRKALRATPESAAIHYYLGNALAAGGRVDEAAGAYREALRLQPDFLDAHYDLGIALRRLGRHDEATACFAAAVKLKPDSAEGWYRLAHAFRDADRCEEGLECLQKALALDPEHVESRWAYAVHQLPGIYAADDDPARFRTAFSVELEKLDHWFDASRAARGFEAVGTVQPFLLAYQEANNRELLQRHGALCARLMAAWAEREKIPAIARDRPAAAVRVGVICGFFSSHPVWNAIIRGWFGQFRRERVALHAFHLGSRQDPETQFAKAHAAHFESGATGLRQWVEAILRQRLDVIIYPEIGMDAMTLKLASLRLAPVQVAAWGHPETSGLPTVDYYLSAEDFEPAHAQSAYTERLVALPHLGCYYSPMVTTTVEPERGSEPLLLCPGVPYKYAPQHDALLAEIAGRLGRCRLVFFSFYANPNLSRKLRERLTRAFARKGLDAGDFVAFVPWQSAPQFHGWLKRADVFLDTVGFSGFNTAMQAVECGLPIVTREGRFMRGRLASGILRRAGLHELVAASDEEYVALAVRLAKDAAYRAEIRERIAAARGILFEDMAPIRGMEDFLVQTARR
jgi:predicted O-linked N-acetylglucosamine transferase (SPINDLY family)